MWRVESAYKCLKGIQMKFSHALSTTKVIRSSLEAKITPAGSGSADLNLGFSTRSGASSSVRMNK
jgi:hypothetical protein